MEGQGALLFAQGMDAGLFQFLMMDIGVLLNDLSRNDSLNILAGAGILKPGQSLEDGLDEALKAAETLERTGVRRGVCPYNNIGLFEMFAPMIKSLPADQPPDGPLKKLLSYDKTHNTAYVQTLRAYLLCPDNLCAGAEMLYIHRHTFKNRLEKIEQLLSLSLNDHYARLQLSMELLLYDLYAV
jgi:DNA-binding PucR family transcriptional regulator